MIGLLEKVKFELTRYEGLYGLTILYGVFSVLILAYLK